MSTLLIDDLRADKKRAGEFFNANSAVLARSYAPGKWSARKVLLHLTDANSVLLDRLRRLQADDKPLLWGFNENHWEERLHYERRDLTVSSALFNATIDAIIELATLTPADRYERIGIHSEIGRKTFAEVLSFVHAHNVHHLDQIDAAINGASISTKTTEVLNNYYFPPTA